MSVPPASELIAWCPAQLPQAVLWPLAGMSVRWLAVIGSVESTSGSRSCESGSAAAGVGEYSYGQQDALAICSRLLQRGPQLLPASGHALLLSTRQSAAVGPGKCVLCGCCSDALHLRQTVLGPRWLRLMPACWHASLLLQDRRVGSHAPLQCPLKARWLLAQCCSRACFCIGLGTDY